MRWVAAASAALFVAVTISSWDGGLDDVLRAWLGVAVLALLLGAWWLFAIEAYRPGIRALDETGAMLHTGDRVSILEPIEIEDATIAPNSGWKVAKIVEPQLRVSDDAGRTSGWIGCDAVYVKRGKQRFPLDDPALDLEVYSRRRLKGEPDRLAANAPLIVVEVRPTQVTILDTKGRKVSLPPGQLRRL